MLKQKIFIIIPAYNEEKRIGRVIDDVKKEGFKKIIVVDDGSTDHTSAISKKKEITILSHLINLGQGASLQTGFDYAKLNGADIVVTFDADGQFKSSEINKIIKPILDKKSDVVLGSRFLGKAINIPFVKYLILKLGIIFTSLFSGVNLTDTHNGFRALSKEALYKIQITQNGMSHASEIIDQMVSNKLSFIEIPITIIYDKYAKKKGQKISNSFSIISQLILNKLD